MNPISSYEVTEAHLPLANMQENLSLLLSQLGCCLWPLLCMEFAELAHLPFISQITYILPEWQGKDRWNTLTTESPAPGPSVSPLKLSDRLPFSSRVAPLAICSYNTHTEFFLFPHSLPHSSIQITTAHRLWRVQYSNKVLFPTHRKLYCLTGSWSPGSENGVIQMLYGVGYGGGKT